MSKIGKKPIQIPKGVEIKINNGLISVKGAKDELKRVLNNSVSILISGDKISVGLQNESDDFAVWGLTRALIANMIRGVTDGFEKNLEFEGVGYKVNVKGDILELNLGYSHPILIKIPVGVAVKVEKNVIKISGSDNELIGHLAAEIKSKRPPEPYKGKGIKYAGEVIRRKAGKKAATAA
ncbi:MAG: 50S ribosomal protein L6 [Candidatus Yanofskybacteria bacterium RIFCSPHIGHO2_01_FULL_39_8b]|uniref:Large ribosomal subunit protein uL6 n=1 Tax=Candidatus Yanofskybacteria bacterium RIFCSPHIGHO2_01_FULL_39_8b TaxID=1802659 RepID=A0A1F8EHR2_9BACT|nr:MAG: 50S ribosomal protein L6 [Candidatus Yanofskybacteria bacterium RIFCSPHIGHO2_01_FULL_39_8b]